MDYIDLARKERNRNLPSSKHMARILLRNAHAHNKLMVKGDMNE